MVRQVLEGDVVVLPVDESNVVDVFTGNGWTHWSRFQVIKGHPMFLKGESLTEKDYKTLCQLVK